MDTVAKNILVQVGLLCVCVCVCVCVCAHTFLFLLGKYLRTKLLEHTVDICLVL